METILENYSPVFVGGTGRSGTTIAARLIAAAEPYALIPIEVRFHCDAGGLADVVAGRTSIDRFVDEMKREWYIRKANALGPRGLHVITSWMELDSALQRFQDEAQSDVVSAAGRLLATLLDPVADRAGAASWVENTPPSVRAARELSLALPSARFIHMVRDGRDVASSVVRRSWGPNDLKEAISWWGDELLKIHESLSSLDSDRVITIRLEHLSETQREPTYRRLAKFLSIEDDRHMHRFFDEEVSSGKAHAGRWRTDAQGQPLPSSELEQIDEAYQAQLGRLKERGFELSS